MNIETANRLYELRKKNGLSQEELADKLGISRQAVSKWERAEASPDTDNLILLAKLYNVSLDELLNSEKATEAAFEANEAKKEEMDDDSVIINNDGIRLHSKDDGEVFIDEDGITHVKKDGTREHKNFEIRRNKSLLEDVISGSIALLAVIAYLVLGLTTKYGWSCYWVVFLLIPIIPSLFEAIRKKRFCVFVYPVFIAMIYLFLGLRFRNLEWGFGNIRFVGFFHPLWILFLTIPVYYSIFGPIDRAIHRNDFEINDDDDDDIIDARD